MVLKYFTTIIIIIYIIHNIYSKILRTLYKWSVHEKISLKELETLSASKVYCENNVSILTVDKVPGWSPIKPGLNASNTFNYRNNSAYYICIVKFK